MLIKLKAYGYFNLLLLIKFIGAKNLEGSRPFSILPFPVQKTNNDNNNN